MISITNLSYYLGDRALYENASLHIKPKDKIGLIGLNGTGKSTLLHLIVGNYQPDSGHISKSGDCTIGFLNQDLLSYQSDESILSVAMQAFERENELQRQMDAIIHEMEVNYQDKLVDRLSRVQEEFEALDGYTIQSKAEEILEGLGFSTNDLQKPLRQFSGGWRMRVMLAKLLLQKPSLLMLDEPTNHLDLPSIQWVEKYVQSYENAVIVVSHDRYFMDKVVDHLLAFQGSARIKDFPGNYTQYREWKEVQELLEKEKEQAAKPKEEKVQQVQPKNDEKKKLSFKEKREFEELDALIPQLEEEKANLENELSSGTLSTDELLQKSNRISQLIEAIEEKTMRWLELSELV